MHRIVARCWCALVCCAAVSVEDTLAQDRTAGARVLESSELAAVFPGLRKTIAVRFEGQSIERALRDIAAKADLDLTYSNIALPKRRVVWLTADRIRADEALEKVLADAGLQLLPLANRRLVVVPSGQGAAEATGSIVGRVRDAKSGQGIASVEIRLDGTRWRTATDTAGWYRLAEVEGGSYTLMVRRVGYGKQSREITVKEQSLDTVDVELEAMAVALDELVTTATGQQRRRDLGNSVTTIRADSVMQTAPIRSLSDLLENRVPGLTTQRTSGAPGDPVRMRLRGLGSIMRSNDPVFIVDGVRVYAAQADGRSGNLTNSGVKVGGVDNKIDGTAFPAPSPLDQIDPNTVEKVEVFKGPSAATLYGADAANGVVVITTKKGRPGPTRWIANYNYGKTAIPGRYPEGYFRFGRIPELGDAMYLCPLIELRCTQDSLVRFQALNDPALTVLDRGTRNLYSLNASGGNQGLTYSLTGTYERETGVMRLPQMELDRFRDRFNHEVPDWMRRPQTLERWSVTSSVSAIVGQSMDVGITSSLSRSEQQRSSLDGQLASLAGAYIDRTSGSYYFPSVERPSNSSGDGQIYYSLASDPDILKGYYTRIVASTINFTSAINANWRPRSWFTMNGQAGINLTPRDDQRELPAGLASMTDSGAYIRGRGQSLVSTFNLRAGVRKPLPWSFAFHLDAGTNLTTTHTEDLVSSAFGLVPGTMTVTGARVVNTSEQRGDLSVFGWYIEPRIVGQRLSLSTGIRLDGGSLYGTRVTTGSVGLPKLNGSWVISEEPWFPFSQIFSSFRLRGAYGQSQVQPGVRDRLRLYTSPSEGAGQWLYLKDVGNVNLRPERSVEFEGGIDADMFDARLNIEFTGYIKNQVDALLPTPLPGSVNGGGTVIRNIGNVRNKGIELSLGISPLRSSSVSWTTQINLSRNVNTLVKLGPGVVSNPQQGLVEGYPVHGRWARPIVGIADINGDGVIERGEVQLADDYAYMGRLLPAYTSSMFNNFSFFGGALAVSTGFDYTGGATQVDQTARTNWVLARGLADPDASFFDQASALMLDVTDYGLTQNVSTFRFNSFSVNYRAPAPIARVIRASQLVVALQGSNLAMHSSYRGKDPNVMAWNAGENIMDTGQLPQPRTWQLSVRLNY